MAFWDYKGETIKVDTPGVDYDKHVKSVNHRGYNTVAPENTLPAFRLSRKMDFAYVETDVSFTSDGVAVCLHDATINRTSNGTGNISEMTFEQVRQYDFSKLRPSYSPCQIPTFEEFIKLCKDIGLHPYIELKSNGAYTEAQVQSIVDMVRAAGMDGDVTYISMYDSRAYLGFVKAYDPSARLGIIYTTVTPAVVAAAQNLKTETNDVFVDANTWTAAAVQLCKDAGVPMEVWTINSTDTIKTLDPYITGVTSDSLIAGKILYEDGMS